MSSDLGDRMKSYERVTDFRLPPNSVVIVRVDGRAFHTYTRQEAFRDTPPFSELFGMAMREAARATSREMAGFKFGYTQSDEATFALTDYDTHDTEGWFGHRLSKLVSVSAALMTAHFIQAVGDEPKGTPVFDARAFTMPLDDAPNVFVWRQRDWQRNSLSMLARHHFSAAQLQGRGRAELHEMLHSVGVNWADLPSWAKDGWFFDREHAVSVPITYKTLREGLDVHHDEDPDE